ncbi:hypothetical protein LINPERHAP1_LOCUS10623 [Linum perenne]
MQTSKNKMHVEKGRRSSPMPPVSTPIFERDSGSRMQTPHISVGNLVPNWYCWNREML